jgi:hypothetical protein
MEGLIYTPAFTVSFDERIPASFIRADQLIEYSERMVNAPNINHHTHDMASK